MTLYSLTSEHILVLCKIENETNPGNMEMLRLCDTVGFYLETPDSERKKMTVRS